MKEKKTDQILKIKAVKRTHMHAHTTHWVTNIKEKLYAWKNGKLVLFVGRFHAVQTTKTSLQFIMCVLNECKSDIIQIIFFAFETVCTYDYVILHPANAHYSCEKKCRKLKKKFLNILVCVCIVIWNVHVLIFISHARLPWNPQQNNIISKFSKQQAANAFLINKNFQFSECVKQPQPHQHQQTTL